MADMVVLLLVFARDWYSFHACDRASGEFHRYMTERRDEMQRVLDEVAALVAKGEPGTDEGADGDA